jgi:hypothetical protein
MLSSREKLLVFGRKNEQDGVFERKLKKINRRSRQKKMSTFTHLAYLLKMIRFANCSAGIMGGRAAAAGYRF